MTEMTDTAVAARITALDWHAIGASPDRAGWAVLPGLFAAAECDETTALYGDEALFRSHVQMARHGFGRGDCRVAVRHGVSAVRSGRRHTLGIIFHDAA